MMTVVEKRRVRAEGKGLSGRMFVAVTAISSVFVICGPVAAGAREDAPRSVPAGRMQFDIPEQPLGQALTTFGRQAGLQVSVDPGLVRGLQGVAVHGSLTPHQALVNLLGNLPLGYQISDGVVILRGVSEGEADAVVLPAVVVEGDVRSQSPYGPGEGYVARRSVVGTKTNAEVVKTPQSISVVTKDEIEARAAKNVNEALRYTAGVATEASGSDDRFDLISGRGFDLNEYLDGTKLLSSSSGFAVPQFDSYLFDRVEVLKGPTSVLYGSASPGGIVNLVSKRPTEDPVHEVLLRGGSDGHMEGAFDLGGPVTEDGDLLYRVTGLARRTGTQVEDTHYQRYFIAPSITWRPTEDTDLTVLLNYQYDPEAGFFNKLPVAGTGQSGVAGDIPRDFYAGDTDFDKFERSTVSVGYNFEHRFTDAVTFRQNARFLHMETDFAAIFSSGTVQADGHTLDRSAFTSDENLNNLTLDNQLEVKLATGPVDHTVLGGVDYQWLSWSQDGRFGGAPSIDFLAPDHTQAITTPPVFADQRQTQRQLGFYAQDQIEYGGWSLLLGGRIDRVGSEVENDRTGVTTKHDDYDFTGRVGLSYLFDNGLAPYVSYSESFEPTSGTDFGGGSFDPTTGRQYEVGIKYQPPGVNALVTLSAYQLTQQNVLTADPVHTGFSVQTGEIRSRGLELEGKASLTSNLSVIASYAYVDAEVTEANDGTKGKTPTGIPKHLASAWADYAFDEGNLKGLGIGGGVRYRGKSQGNNANTFQVADAVLFDAAVRYDLGALAPRLAGVQLAVNGSNLLDKEYIARCQDTGCYYGLGRTVLATLKYTW
ncbi:MAG: TonB-dependent siderophore receptor [Rhodospirillum sp.]|nr:TonB-dependent siderophore receptor [Rhodospirillum sp.]MCF8490248.1 TonB-dependent siderophore receptor [Rhodospirillum sp.]